MLCRLHGGFSPYVRYLCSVCDECRGSRRTRSEPRDPTQRAAQHNLCPINGPHDRRHPASRIAFDIAQSPSERDATASRDAWNGSWHKGVLDESSNRPPHLGKPRATNRHIR
jgi:hypothetical protein